MSETTSSKSLSVFDESTAIQHLRPPVTAESLAWRDLRNDEYWRQIPAWKDIDEATFLNHLWQEKNAITSLEKLVAAVQDLISSEFRADVEAGFHKAPMAVRISPYLLSLIDWKNPLNNDFYIAEEVTIKGNREKRPDVVLYVNGIALGVIELKKSSKSIGEGVRQNLTNQRPFLAA